MKSLLFGTAKSRSLSFDFSCLLIRLFFGIAMALQHGLGKVPPSEKFVGGIEAMGLPFPFVMGWAAGLSELVGGILLALGLLTRPSAFLLSITMLVAAFISHAGDPFAGKEKALMYLVVFVAIFISGGGRFSIDRVISGSGREFAR